MAKKSKEQPITMTQQEIICYAIQAVGPLWMKEREMLKQAGMGTDMSMYWSKLKVLTMLYKIQTGTDYELEAAGYTLDM